MTTTPDEMLSQSDLCARLGLSERAVRNLTRRGMPREPRNGCGGRRGRYGLYPWPAVLAWYRDFKTNEKAQRAAGYSRRRRCTSSRSS